MSRAGNVELSADEFERIAVLVKSLTGMNYQHGKETLVRQRLGTRLRELNKNSFHDYIDYVESEKSQQEMVRLLDLLTTNKTSFFRENQHFEFLAKNWIPEMEKKKPSKIRMWSSACSSGQEPYSMAMHLHEKLSKKLLSKVKILATDLSTEILSSARRGVYPESIVNQLDDRRKSTFMKKGQGSPPLYQVKEAVRKMVHFSRLNLIGDWPMNGPFDVIFCRNVMIYFDKETQERLVNRFWSLLPEGGYLLIGHSESLSGTKHPFKYIQPAVWQK